MFNRVCCIDLNHHTPIPKRHSVHGDINISDHSLLSDVQTLLGAFVFFIINLVLAILAPPEHCQDAFPLKQVKGSATVPQSAPASQAS